MSLSNWGLYMGGNIRNDTEIYLNDTILQEIYVMKESNYEWNP